jgi:hypothetical protein
MMKSSVGRAPNRPDSRDWSGEWQKIPGQSRLKISSSEKDFVCLELLINPYKKISLSIDLFEEEREKNYVY